MTYYFGYSEDGMGRRIQRLLSNYDKEVARVGEENTPLTIEPFQKQVSGEALMQVQDAYLDKGYLGFSKQKYQAQLKPPEVVLNGQVEFFSMDDEDESVVEFDEDKPNLTVRSRLGDDDMKNLIDAGLYRREDFNDHFNRFSKNLRLKVDLEDYKLVGFRHEGSSYSFVPDQTAVVDGSQTSLESFMNDVVLASYAYDQEMEAFQQTQDRFSKADLSYDLEDDFVFESSHHLDDYMTDELDLDEPVKREDEEPEAEEEELVDIDDGLFDEPGQHFNPVEEGLASRAYLDESKQRLEESREKEAKRQNDQAEAERQQAEHKRQEDQHRQAEDDGLEL